MVMFNNWLTQFLKISLLALTGQCQQASLYLCVFASKSQSFEVSYMR